MKNIYLLTVIIIFNSFMGSLVYAQNIGINADGSAPNPNAMLDIKSNTKGMLIPRTSTTSRIAIPNTKGLLVYDTTTNSFWYNDGTIWNSLSSNNKGWSLSGNANTDSAINFIGTTDSIPLVIKVYNHFSGEISPGPPFSTAWGYKALSANTTGLSNTAMGRSALYSNITGSYNTGLGANANYYNTSGSDNTAVGSNTMEYNTGDNNTAIGSEALMSNTTGAYNTAVGWQSGYNNLTGHYNISVGVGAMQNNRSGYFNTALGDFALAGTQFASGNVAVGNDALRLENEGSNNTAVGNSALYINYSGNQNTAIGDSALYHNYIGSVNTASGNYALFSNQYGSLNTAMGVNALYANTSGTDNTAVGVNSLLYNVLGIQNTAIGSGALYGSTGSNNTAIGYLADVNPGVNNASAIGSHAFASADNTINIGNNSIISVNSTGIFHTISDGRFKFNVKENVKGLDFILKLRPVTYQLDVDALNANKPTTYNTSVFKNISNKNSSAMLERRSGFIAQEVEQAANETGFDFDAIHKPENDNDHYSLSYAGFVVPLVKSIQELSAENDSLKKKMENADVDNKDLHDQVKNLMLAVNVLNEKLEKITEEHIKQLDTKSTNKSN